MDEETKLVINCTITSCGHVLPPTSVTFILSSGSVPQCVHNITVQYKCTLNISVPPVSTSDSDERTSDTLTHQILLKIQNIFIIKYLTKWRVFDNVCSRLCWRCQHQWSSFWYQPVSPTIPRLQPSPASVQVKIFLRLQDSDSDVHNRFWFSPLLSTETRIKLFVPKLNIFPLPGTFWKIL